MRLLLDTCVWGGALNPLVAAGHDVIWAGHWATDPGDAAILEQAFAASRVLVTLDKDFGELAVLHGQSHAGIVRLVDWSALEQSEACIRALDRYGAELQQGALVTVERGRFRNGIIQSAPPLGRADRLLSPRRDGPLLLIDLHTHSYPASEDAFAAVAEMIDRAKELGLEGICLTDHDAFWPAATVADLRRRHNFPVFAGSEINTDAGHILVFGPQRYIFGMHKPAFLRQEVNRCGGVMIAAHPYRRRFLADPGRQPAARAEMLKRAIADDFFLSCDAIEGINGRGTAVENEFSQDLAAVFHLNSTGGSDAHRLEQLGTAATRFDHPITDLPDLIREIKAGRFRSEILK